jgi:uncharacterized protein (TIGR03435 family)
LNPLLNAAQAPLPSQRSTPLTFDVASIKERSNAPLGLVGLQTFPGRLVDGCATLTSLVFFAYSRTRSTPINGLPDWASTPCSNDSRANTYEFQATMPPETTDAQARQMMQTLLADRFKLAVHWERKDLPIYGLVIASSGFKLKPSDSTDDPPRARGSLGCPADDRRCRIIALGSAPLSVLAGALGSNVGRPVIDRTALPGTYYFDLKWAGDTSPDSSLPALPTLLKEQFGLELKSDTGPVDILVIDHAEKPSPN